MTAQIELYEKLNDPLQAIDKIGQMFARSGMFGCEKVEQGQVLALACIAERKSPIQIVREYHIIEGKLSDRADAMLAKLKAKGGKYRILSRTPDKAEIEITYEGQIGVFNLTWEEAQKEPFVWMGGSNNKELKKNWRTPRARMQTLWARVVSDGVRALAPEIVSGIYTPEEVSDESNQTGSSIDLSQTATQPTKPADSKPEPAPIEIEAKVVTESKPVVQPPAEQDTKPQATPTETQPTSQSPVTQPTAQKLSDALVDQLEKTIGEDAVAAMKWMLANGRLKPGQSLADLPEKTALSIIQFKDRFLRVIRNQDQPTSAQ